MKFCMPIVVAAALLLAADGPEQGTKDSPAPPGWSFATEGSGIPANQNATDYALGVDREVTHGGRASVSLARSSRRRRASGPCPSSSRPMPTGVGACAWRVT